MTRPGSAAPSDVAILAPDAVARPARAGRSAVAACAMLVGMERASYWRSPWGWQRRYDFLGQLTALAVVFTVISPPEDEPVLKVVLRFLVIGPVVVAVTTLVFNRMYWWPSVGGLSPADRRQVKHSVAWGHGPTDPRLAPTVAESAAHILRRTAKPDPTSRGHRYDRWFGYVALGGWAALASFMTLRGSAPTATALWAVIVVPFLFRKRLRTVHQEIRTNAERAETAAQASLVTKSGQQ